jgi:hypothetical protein
VGCGRFKEEIQGQEDDDEEIESGREQSGRRRDQPRYHVAHQSSDKIAANRQDPAYRRADSIGELRNLTTQPGHLAGG